MTPEQIDAALARHRKGDVGWLPDVCAECAQRYPCDAATTLHALRDALTTLTELAPLSIAAERDAAEAKVQAGLSLHTEDYELGPTGTCRECYGEDYPCATRRALTDTKDDHA